MNRMMLRRRVLMASLMNSGLPLSDLPEGSVQYYDGTDGDHPQSRVRGITSGFLYKCVKSHTSQADWPPERTPALRVVINTSSPGTSDDPILAARGMEYEYGKYYLDPEDGKTYLCKRGEETGSIVLYYMPHELIGQYFEEVT